MPAVQHTKAAAALAALVLCTLADTGDAAAGSTAAATSAHTRGNKPHGAWARRPPLPLLSLRGGDSTEMMEPSEEGGLSALADQHQNSALDKAYGAAAAFYDGAAVTDSTPPSPREAHAGFRRVLNQRFPGAARESEFMASAAAELAKLGFRGDNSIACVGMCRDEICVSLLHEVQAHFGEAFGLRGLAGFTFAGRTGFGAAHAHSPVGDDGREKYVYVVAPHIAIDSDGGIGNCERAGRDGASKACGALAALHGQLSAGGTPEATLDLEDLEMSALRSMLLQHIPEGTVPDLAELTTIAARVIAEKQVKATAEAVVDTSKADYAVIAGIQIHGPGLQQTYFMPLPELCYAVVNGVRTPVPIDEAVAPLVKGTTEL